MNTDNKTDYSNLHMSKTVQVTLTHQKEKVSADHSQPLAAHELAIARFTK